MIHDAAATIYADSLHNHYRPFFANWQLNTPLQLDDYGTLTNNILCQLGNIRDEGIDFGEI